MNTTPPSDTLDPSATKESTFSREEGNPPPEAPEGGEAQQAVRAAEQESEDDDDEEEERHPPDFILALGDFMEDVCQIEAHVWAAERALRDARMIDDIRLADDGLEATLGRERAYFLLNSVADAAEEAAERAHKLRMPLVAYCARQRIELWRKLDEEDAERERKAGEDTPSETGEPR